MSSLNQKNTALSTGMVAPSYEGNVQSVKYPEQQLLEVVTMTLWGNSNFYESNDERLSRIQELVTDIVRKGNCDFIANVIQYARDKMHIRSVPIIVAVVFANVLRTEGVKYPPLRSVICNIIGRADHITDMYSVALMIFGDKKNIPMAIKRGVADSFNKFNEYQFGKYNRSNAVKFRDVLRIVHPKPSTPEQGMIFNRIMTDTLTVPETHEVFFSTNGQLPVDERETNAQIWSWLINNKKLGYQASLMNIRRMLIDQVDIYPLKVVAERLINSIEIEKSKMLPFQFMSAYNAVLAMDEVPYKHFMLTTLSDAIDISLTNVPVIGNDIIIIIDLSASMQTYSNARKYNNDTYRQSTGTPAIIAALFAAALYKSNVDARNITIIGFSDNASFIQVNPRDSVVTMQKNIINQTKVGGTNIYAALTLIESSVKFIPDTVILLSDMQVQTATQYNRHSADANKYFPKDCLKLAINLDAYETTPCAPYNGWTQLQGWSTRIFDLIPAMKESNIKSAVKLLSHPYSSTTV